MSEKAAVREKLFAAVEESIDIDGTTLVGFIVIAECRGADGSFWLSKISGDHSGSLPTWRQRGYCAEVVHDMWGEHEDDESDDE